MCDEPVGVIKQSMSEYANRRKMNYMGSAGTHL